MGITIENQSAAVQPIVPSRSDGLRWLGDLAISILIAAPYAMSLLGGIIRPTNIAWLEGDPAMCYIAWTMFRLGSGLHWPLMYTAALGYPIGASISLVDPCPIVALLLRPFSAILPAGFQYLGPYAVLCLILQLFFGVRLLRSILPGRQLAVWLGGLFFLIAPPMTYRFVGHFAAASHWVILAALLLYTRIASGAYSVRGTMWRVAVLTLVSVGINPYIAVMAVSALAVACFTAVVKHHMSTRAGLGVFVVIGVCFVLSADAFGLIGTTSHELTAEGYRYYSMNVLAPIDPSPAGSSVMPSQRTFTHGQYEGYNYLGAGTLALVILAVFVTLTGRIELIREDLVKWAPVTVCGVVFTVLALSTLVSMGDRAVFDWDPSQRLTPYLAAFRASGRLFWLSYYLITTYAVVSAIRFLKPRDGIVILSAVLALQIYDTGPLRQQLRDAHSGSAPGNLTSPVWRTLNREHRNLMVLPALQCKADTPGDADGYRIFGLLAAEQGLTINSYYVSRYRQDDLKFQCNKVIEQVSKEGLAAHTAYVVSPQVGRMISNGPTGADHCYSVDGFILCTMSEIAGVGHWPGPVPEAPLGAGDLRAQDDGYFTSGWATVTPGFGTWSLSTEAVLAYRTPQTSAKSLRLGLMTVVGKSPVIFSVIHEEGRFEAVIPPASPSVIYFFTVRLPIGTGPTAHEVTIVTKQLQSPLEQGFNTDSRKMGIGVHSLAADACPPSSAIDSRPPDAPACVIK